MSHSVQSANKWDRSRRLFVTQIWKRDLNVFRLDAVQDVRSQKHIDNSLPASESKGKDKSPMLKHSKLREGVHLFLYIVQVSL